MSRSLPLLGLALALALAISIQPTLAAEPQRIFVGRVSQVLVIGKGHPRCPVDCPPGQTCVTNSCGCAEATVVPSRAVSGSLPTEAVVVSQSMDEWCRVPSPPGSAVLVAESSGNAIAGALWQDPYRFNPQEMPVLGGIQTSELPMEDGLVKLSDLEGRLAR